MMYYLRHTAVHNPLKLCYGQSEMALADSFKDEVYLIRQKLKSVTFDQVYSSPSHRCLQLASSLYPDLDIKIDDRLLELNFGDWEQIPWQNIEEKQIKLWAEDFVHRTPPKGESFLNLSLRVQSFHDDFAQTGFSLAICHGGILRALSCLQSGICLNRAFDRDWQYGSLLKISKGLATEP